ncbi:TRAP transporter small permease [Pseudorhodobacter wandonensis]|jgi:TRAP-type C4-dicarboxylate transport system permease small subunit|uniref:TRAP transporter small permease n=1 Tax=Pseudorhodobacter wandonensis TaxID=1120568 RepID=UPI00067BC0C5|nr:TRAP transporter small permease subunit [Pseudorhodobacter wandonensis]
MGVVLDKFANVLRVLLAILMGSLAIPVAMQVISRYTGIIPTYLWTEELSTFIFVWVVMIGSMVAVWDGIHFDVRVTPDAKRPLMILLQNGVVLVLILVFAMLFAFYGIEYAKFGSIQNSVMMRANLMVTFISVPIAGVVWTLFAGYRLYEAISIYRKSREDFV